MWLWGIEGQGVWRGEVFVWQRHRHGAVRRERGAGRVCGAGEATRERRCESVARERGRGERMGDSSNATTTIYFWRKPCMGITIFIMVYVVAY